MKDHSTTSALGKDSAPLSPDEIRSIREGLGLTQAEAGELLGGGPRAFSKYERGAVTPAATTMNLLRLLEASPAALSALTGRKTPVLASGGGPFEVTGRHVAVLTERMFAVLLRKLLTAEALAHAVPPGGVHVSGSITTPDGGEDGRIEWTDGPERTPFLPGRLVQFQLKAGPIDPKEAGADVLTPKGLVKAMVGDVLGKGGVYIMLSTHAFTKEQIDKRRAAIQVALTGAGLAFAAERIVFRDGDQIAEWINRHPSVATWLLENTQPGLIGPFRTWTHWAGRPEHEALAFVPDARLAPLQDALRKIVTTPRGVARVVGPSGIGKSRLVLEALGPTDAEEQSGTCISDQVLYAVEGEAGGLAIKATVQALADSGLRALVVVDRCSPQDHQDLAGMVGRKSSNLSLVSIDDDVAGAPDAPGRLLVPEASVTVTEGIFKQILPDLPSEDERRLVKFSRGYPRIAVLIGRVWSNGQALGHATDDTLVEAAILGRNPREPDMIRRAAQILSVFGLVGAREPVDSDLDEVAPLGRDLTTSQLRAAINDLLDRGVAQRRGRYVILQPRPIALRLADRQWRDWSSAEWDSVLAGAISPALKINAARQLTLLNTTTHGRAVVAHVTRSGGPLDGLDRLSQPGHAEILSALAEVDAPAVADLIERALANADLAKVTGDVRRHLVWALEKISFQPDTFEDGARLLLKLATVETEDWGNNATGQFKELFPVLLGNTAADGAARLAVLDEALEGGAAERRLATAGLIAGIKITHFSRGVGAETHGARAALEPWSPATWGDIYDYVGECLTRLGDVACGHDDTAALARAAIGDGLRALIGRADLIDTVEAVVAKVAAASGNDDLHWPEALDSLGDLIQFDGADLPVEQRQRINALAASLQPETLVGRLRRLVTEMPWDYPVDEDLDLDVKAERQIEAIRTLAREALATPDALVSAIPALTSGGQRMAWAFGKAIAELADNPLDWLAIVRDAVEAAPVETRNFELLAGIVQGLAGIDPAAVSAFKQAAAQSAPLAPGLPYVCWRLGVTAEDIPLVTGAFIGGRIPPFSFMQWTLGGPLANVPPKALSPLFDALLDAGADSYGVALEVIGMYGHGDKDRWTGLMPQVRKIADNAGRWPRRRHSTMDRHHFDRIINWTLARGREDSDARAVALSLAKGLVAVDDRRDDALFENVVSSLLARLPEIVWPLIGQAIVSGRGKAWRLEHLLGETFGSDRKSEPPILHLPQDTLFAWCHAHPNVGPAFVAAALPLLTAPDPETKVRALHPAVRRLLIEFGTNDDVLARLSGNIRSFIWVGSRSDYYRLYEGPFQELLTHPVPKVRRWAKNTLQSLATEIDHAREEDEERDAKWEI